MLPLELRNPTKAGLEDCNIDEAQGKDLKIVYEYHRGNE